MTTAAAQRIVTYEPRSLPPIVGARKFLADLYGGERVGLVYLVRESEFEGFNLAEPDSLDRMAERAIEIGDVLAATPIFEPGGAASSVVSPVLPHVLAGQSRLTTAGVSISLPALIRCARSAVCDFDGGGEDGGFKLDPRMLPSLMVTSGSVTDGRPHFHGVFHLDRPVDAAELEEIQRSLTVLHQGDARFKVSRIRIPGCEFPNKLGEAHTAQAFEAVIREAGD